MRPRTRRSFLALAGGVGATSTAGCLLDSDAVSVLAAGSLATALDAAGDRFQNDSGTSYYGEYHGSNAVVQMVLDRTQNPDVVISADVDLLRTRLVPEYANWDVVFAGNEVGLAYSPRTALGERLAAGDRPWYDLLREAPEGAVAISDPDLDPLGYRALMLFDLAAEYYDVSGLREDIVARAQFEVDEPRLLADLETGNRAVAVAYRNMAVARDLPFYSLPPALNFGDPARAQQYAQATYTTEDGYTATGSPVLYNATVPDTADNPEAGREFVGFLLDNPGTLLDSGLTVPESIPVAQGDVPDLPTQARLGGGA